MVVVFGGWLMFGNIGSGCEEFLVGSIGDLVGVLCVCEWWYC